MELCFIPTKKFGSVSEKETTSPLTIYYCSMKKNLSLFALLFSLGTASSCNRAEEPEFPTETISVSIPASEVYSHSLGNFGIEEGASVLIEPEHAAFSQLERKGGREIIYTYKAESGFRGKDYVELLSARGSAGDGENPYKEVVRMQIVVTD